jgi:hypothetical protein
MIEDLASCAIDAAIVETEPVVCGTAGTRLDAKPLIGAKVPRRNPLGRHVLAPQMSDPGVRGTSDLYHKPAPPFIELERKQVDTTRNEPAKMGE